MKKHLPRIAMGIVVMLVLLAHASDRFRIPLIDSFESIIYDTRLRLTMPGGVDPRIVILDIDEKSLAEPPAGEGRWPWPRNRLALLLDQLFDRYQIAVVGFDVVFAEKDNSSGYSLLEKLSDTELKGVPQYQTALSQLKPQLDYDGLFAKAMKDRAVVLGYTFLTQGIDETAHAAAAAQAAKRASGSFERALRAVGLARAPEARQEGVPLAAPIDRSKGVLPLPVLKAEDFGQHPPNTKLHYDGYTGNLPDLQKNAALSGHFNPEVEEDGITRRAPMLIPFKGGYYEALSLAIFRLILGSPPVLPETNDEYAISSDYVGLERLRVGKYRIPVDDRAIALIPYRGPPKSFDYFPLVDVINGKVPVEDLKGKIALVGTRAPGLFDLRATPVDPTYPGVEIHANLIAGMLDENLKQKPPYAGGAEFGSVLLLGLVLALWLPALSPPKATALVLTALLLATAGNVALFQYEHLVLPLASQVVLILVLFTLNMAYGFFIEARGRKQITGLFGQYVPPEVVDQMAQDPETASMRGESREMTVLFTDVRGFTTISEGLEAQALSTLMNEFLTPLTEVIYKHRGTIDKYMGDCIMAFWGAPLKDPDHARNGVLAGLEMQRTLKALQPTFRARNWPEIRIGVGLNTGRMSVGNMGSKVRLAYTVMGDAVNLASRLEGITKEYGADIIVGEDTKNAVPDVVFREIDRVRVKGKDTAVTIYEPLGIEGQVPNAVLDDAALFHEALELYRRQEWDLAELRLLRLKTLSPDARLYDLFLERIALLRMSPPSAGWDGAFTFSTK